MIKKIDSNLDRILFILSCFESFIQFRTNYLSNANYQDRKQNTEVEIYLQ